MLSSVLDRNKLNTSKFQYNSKTDDKSPLEPKTYNKVVLLKKNYKLVIHNSLILNY